jgi:hypothetical protein
VSPPPLSPAEADRAALRHRLVRELVNHFLGEGFAVHGAFDCPPYSLPPLIKNDQFGERKPRRPDVVAFDKETHRILFGVVRPMRTDLDTEQSLEEYNLFLDHNSELGEAASRLYVIMPSSLIPEFTNVITHYIHREYWHRVVTVASEAELIDGR